MTVAFRISWLDHAQADRILRLLEAIRSKGSLAQAARETGLSYRFAWGLLADASHSLGSSLVESERGRGARLTPFGEALVLAEERVQRTLAPHCARPQGQLPRKSRRPRSMSRNG